MLRKQEYDNNLKTSFNVEGRQRLASATLAVLKISVRRQRTTTNLPENF